MINCLIAASGRKHDVRALLGRLAQDEFTLTIIYGPSGVGKSSLIEAGLLPALAQERFDNRRVVPIHLRRYGNWMGDLDRLLAWSSNTPLNPPLVRGETRSPSPYQGEGWGGVIRQTETISQSSPENQATTIESLVQLLRQRISNNQVVVFVFDQFEEFFFEWERAPDRRKFYDFLRHCLELPYTKTVLSLREDYTHYLLECNRRTDLDIIDNNILDKKWLYYLGNFSPKDARSVIQDLTRRTTYAPQSGLINQLVADLTTDAGEVRPIELQIVGAQLQTEGMETLDAYQAQGSQNRSTKEVLVQRYLANVVDECGPESNQKLADQLLFLLTDARGTRPLKTQQILLDDLQTTIGNANVDNDMFTLVLKILTQSALVIQVPDLPDDRYQLIHDYLAAFIRTSQQPLIIQVQQERQQRLEEQNKRVQAEKRHLQHARWAAVGLGALAVIAMVAGGIAYRREVNAEIITQSLAMEAYLSAGLEEPAVIQAVRTGQVLQKTSQFAQSKMSKDT